MSLRQGLHGQTVHLVLQVKSLEHGSDSGVLTKVLDVRSENSGLITGLLSTDM